MHFEHLKERFMNTIKFFNNNARHIKVIETKTLKLIILSSVLQNSFDLGILKHLVILKHDSVH